MRITSVINNINNQKNKSNCKRQQNFTANMGRVSKDVQEMLGASENDILEFLAQPEHIGKIKGIYSKKNPWSSIKIDLDETRFKTGAEGRLLIISANADRPNTILGYSNLLIPQNFKIKETPSFVDTLVETMQKATDNIRF